MVSEPEGVLECPQSPLSKGDGQAGAGESNKMELSFPGGSVVKCRRHGFDPWSGKIPHPAEQLGPCTAATEPTS